MKLLQYNLIIRLLCKNFCTYRSQLFIKEKENRGPWIPLFLLENKLNSNTIVTPTDLHFSIFAFKGRAKGARWVEILVDLKQKTKNLSPSSEFEILCFTQQTYILILIIPLLNTTIIIYTNFFSWLHHLFYFSTIIYESVSTITNVKVSLSYSFFFPSLFLTPLSFECIFINHTK